MRAPVILALSILLGGGAWAIAQMNHGDHSGTMDHATHDGSSASPSTKGAVLTEPGQGAFGALSEVVRVLEADPATDWSKVDIDALRAHLRDMDRLVSDAVVETTELPKGLTMQATGDAETVATIRRMVPAHAAQLARDQRWMVEARRTDSGATLIVKSNVPAVVARIKGLGFFGLMASQDHHREHHLMMARGQAAHAHGD